MRRIRRQGEREEKARLRQHPGQALLSKDRKRQIKTAQKEAARRRHRQAMRQAQAQARQAKKEAESLLDVLTRPLSPQEKAQAQAPRPAQAQAEPGPGNALPTLCLSSDQVSSTSFLCPNSPELPGMPTPPPPGRTGRDSALEIYDITQLKKSELLQVVVMQIVEVIDRLVVEKAPELEKLGLSGVLEGWETGPNFVVPTIVVPQLDAEVKRLEGVYCEAMVFAAQYLSEWCYLPPSAIHDPILRAITESAGFHVLAIGPREFAKTTMALIAELHDGLKLRRLFQTHMSSTDRLAQKKLWKLIEQLDTNKALQHDFQLMPGRTQRQDYWEVKVGYAHPTIVTWQAVGWEGAVRGERESRIVADDIDKKEDSSLVWTKNYDKLHGTVMGALRNTDDAFLGQVVVLGNYIGDNCTVDLLERLDVVDLPHVWKMVKFAALELGNTEQITKIPVGRSVWPQYMSTKALEEKRRTMNQGEAWSFELEYLNLKVNPANRVWEPEMFEQTYTELPARHRLSACVCIDPTDSQSTASDQVAVISMAKCLEGPMEGYYYVLDCRIARLTPREVANEAMRQYVGTGSKTNPVADACYIEDRSNRGIGALQQIVEDKARENNVAMNVHRVVPQTYGDKRRRALKVVDIGRQLRILFPQHLSADMRKLKEQLKMFTGQSQHSKLPAIDDGHDAFVWCLLMLREVFRADHPWDDEDLLTIRDIPRAVGAR